LILIDKQDRATSNVFGFRFKGYNMKRRFKNKPINNLAGYLDGLVNSKLWVKVILGMMLGILVGYLLGPSMGLVSPKVAVAITGWAALPGRLFLVLIKMIVIPLVFASVILGIAENEDMEMLKRLGPRIVIYFIFTTMIAITIGFGSALIIKPGHFEGSEKLKSQVNIEEIDNLEGAGEAGLNNTDTLPETLISIIPDNPLDSAVSGEMLQVVIFAIIFGVALISISKTQSKAMMELLKSLQEVCMQVVKWAMKIAPIAVFGLMTETTSKIGLDVLKGLGIYVLTVLVGLFFLLIFYFILVFIVSGFRPHAFIRKIREVQLLAFSTSSSAAVMPLSMETAQKKLGVSEAISKFVIPLGATINMDGTALYQGVATVFLAQIYGVELSIVSLVLVMVTAVGASIGTPGTPGVGIIILATVLVSVGIPTDGIALILGVDRILDMSRTAVNVTGDLTACLVMSRLVGEGEALAKSS
jgi:Na+/H+-dicarboxylate symporter